MYRTTVLFLSIMVLSCQNSFHSPDEQEIQKAVKNKYEKRNEAAGGGGWTVNEVQVLRNWPGDDKRHYNAEVSVKGVHTSPPLAVRRPDEPINETVEVALIWRDGGWIVDDK